ncbi:MAG: hypothetical protein IJV50_00130 [Lachnospiraceae bacterium]|nr:hypothetical protein [Lachnospiraceae bacterium]
MSDVQTMVMLALIFLVMGMVTMQQERKTTGADQPQQGRSTQEERHT